MGVAPQALQNRPTLDNRQRYYYKIYQDLSGSRGTSMVGALPIPVAQILAYCELFKIHPLHERAQIFQYVQQMDSVFLTHVAKKHAKPAPKPADMPVRKK